MADVVLASSSVTTAVILYILSSLGTKIANPSVSVGMATPSINSCFVAMLPSSSCASTCIGTWLPFRTRGAANDGYVERLT